MILCTWIIHLSRGQFRHDSVAGDIRNLSRDTIGDSDDLKNENIIRGAESNIYCAQSTRTDTEVIR